MDTDFWCVNLQDRDYQQDLGIDGIILKLTLNKLGIRVWSDS